MRYIKQHGNLGGFIISLITIMLLMGSGCGSNGDLGSQGSSATGSEALTPVTIRFIGPDVSESVEAEFVQRSVDMPPGLQSIQVQVTAADITTPIQQCAAVTGGQLPTITLQVASGANRTFTASAFQSSADCTGTPSYKGQTTLTLAAGVATTVNITLALFQSGNPSVTSTFPGVDGTGVATTTSITATFDRDMDATSLTAVPLLL